MNYTTQQKSMKNKYLVLNSCLDPYYNLALEEYLLLHYRQGMLVMLWQNENTIVIGRHQNAYEEINRSYVKKQGIHVVRRTTGGGAVYHDLGNLNYSFITEKEETIDAGMKKFTGLIIEALQKLGLNAEFSGRNDILVDGRKVSGTAQRMDKERILHHGCLLFDSDLSKVAQSLNVRPEKFSSKAVKSVQSRIGNIREYLSEPMSMEEFKVYLIKALLEKGGYELLELSPVEQAQVQKLQKEKYAAWEWTYSHPLKCSVHNYKRYEGGSIEAYADVKDGSIVSLKIFGDFMALKSVEKLEQALVGCRFRYQDVLTALKQFQLFNYLGSIKAEEMAATICCEEDTK